MRTLMTIAILSALAPTAAWAQEACGQLQILNTVQMTREGNMDFVPVRINGAAKSFLFDTGGSLTLLKQSTADDLKLPVQQGDIEMYDMTGKVARGQATVHEYIVGVMRGTDVAMQVVPRTPADGIMGLAGWIALDLDVDFGTDKLNMFSPSHCAGRVQYWTAPALAVVPISMDGLHMTIPVMLDGKLEQAEIDTGAQTSTLTIAEAKRVFDLTMGSADAPEHSMLNGDPSLKTYTHNFKTLSFGNGDVMVKNPQVEIIPDVVGREAGTRQLVGNRTRTERDRFNAPDMLIGMDVLRKLHLYMAFKENKLYITDASAPVAAATPAQ